MIQTLPLLLPLSVCAASRRGVQSPKSRDAFRTPEHPFGDTDLVNGAQGSCAGVAIIPTVPPSYVSVGAPAR